jgi:TRAP-type C4-dicarboxylate transport system permease large subunit
MLPVILLAGIYGGVTTPTEAAAGALSGSGARRTGEPFDEG